MEGRGSQEQLVGDSGRGARIALKAALLSTLLELTRQQYISHSGFRERAGARRSLRAMVAPLAKAATPQRLKATYIAAGLIVTAWTGVAGAETLQQAWEAALAADHRLEAAREQSAAAEAALAVAKAARLPGFSLQAGYRVLDAEPAARAYLGPTPMTFPVAEKSTLSWQAIAAWPLYTSGRIRAGIEAADASLVAARTRESVELQELKLRVAEAYVNVLRARRALAVAESHVASLESHARDVENLHAQGMVPRNDLLAARVALADASQGAIRARNGLDLARSAYNRLLGRPLEQPVQLEELGPVPVDGPLERLTERALRQRPELRTLREQIRALERRALAVRAENGPQLALSGGYGYQQNRYQVHEGQWQVELGMQWRLFDGGAADHRAAITRRQAAALQAQYNDLRSLVALEVRQHWLALDETRQRIRVTEQAVRQAGENLRVSRDRYENGLATNSEVLDAEALRVRSESNHANAIHDAVLAAVRLKRAAGEL